METEEKESGAVSYRTYVSFFRFGGEMVLCHFHVSDTPYTVSLTEDSDTLYLKIYFSLIWL